LGFLPRQVGIGENKVLPHTKKIILNWASEAHAGGIKFLFTFGILSMREIR
jgi:hypothetical protein